MEQGLTTEQLTTEGALADMLRKAAAEYLAYADEIDPRAKGVNEIE